VELGHTCRVLDGDELRRTVSADLGFSPSDRAEQARRTSRLAKEEASTGALAVAAIISPYAADREAARRDHEQAGLRFLEVFVATPLEECERRDTRGLYAAARSGAIDNLTGVNAPYEPPAAPEITVGPDESPQDAAERVLAFLG
jgi:bifunctional enzyme CysN/CysC